jgi:outer membrane lipoprotein-sorting protein
MKTITILWIVLFASGSVFANKSPEEKIRNYFSSLKNIKAEFVQVDEYGNTQTGKLFLSIPGKLRWEYSTPRDVLIIMNEEKVYYYDKDLDHGSHYLGSRGLASIFSGKDVLSLEAIKVLEMSSGAETSKVLFGNKESPERIMLIFNNDPFSIEGFLIENESQDKVSIQLNNIQLNGEIKDSLFQYKVTKPSRKR